MVKQCPEATYPDALADSHEDVALRGRLVVHTTSNNEHNCRNDQKNKGGRCWNLSRVHKNIHGVAFLENILIAGDKGIFKLLMNLIHNL